MDTLYTVRFEAYTNADWVDAFEVAEDGAARDLTSVTIAMGIRNAQTGAALTTLSSDTGEIVKTDAANGLFKISIPAATMSTYPAGLYDHDCTLTESGQVTMLWQGKLKIVEGIT